MNTFEDELKRSLAYFLDYTKSKKANVLTEISKVEMSTKIDD